MSTAAETILAIQALLLIPEKFRAPRMGPRTREALDNLAALPPDAPFTPTSSPPQPAGLHRSISERGLALIKHFESCLKPTGDGRFTAYDDGGGVLTIGWGHTGLQHNDGTVRKGRVITRQEADELLAYDMRQFEARVAALVDVGLTDDEHAALVSFDFNTGGLAKSTLLKKLNAGDRAGAAAEFPKWNKDNKRVVAGLTRRRAAERCLFLSDLAGMTKLIS